MSEWPYVDGYKQVAGSSITNTNAARIGDWVDVKIRAASEMGLRWRIEIDQSDPDEGGRKPFHAYFRRYEPDKERET